MQESNNKQNLLYAPSEQEPAANPYPHRNALLEYAAIKFNKADIWWFILTLLILGGTIALGIWEAQHP